MNPNTILQKVKFLFGAFVVLAIMALAGCSPVTSNKEVNIESKAPIKQKNIVEGNFDSKGLPNRKYLVGGGLDIEWRVPQNGTVYLVEETTGKIVITKSFPADKVFEFNPGSTEPEKTKEIFGIDMSELKFSLYFIPNTKR